MTGSEVLLDVRKFDGRPHKKQPFVRLGEDAYGVWLGAPAGTVIGTGNAEAAYATEEARVMLFPRDAWWTALFLAAPARLEFYCDVTTPSEWPSPAEVTMVDLDLDVCRLRETGAVFIDDEDEFASHRVLYGYPPEVVARATGAAEWLAGALREGAEPFGSRFHAWLELVG
ncbi:DUF402 domain-containing protein [Streptomyces sp. NPDC001108]